jgi:NADH-quinone oxidoreductase subunit L
MTSSLDLLLAAIVGLPLVAALITAALGKNVLKEQSHLPAILAIGGAFLCSVALLMGVMGGQRETAISRGPESLAATGYEHVWHVWTWVEIPDAMSVADSPSSSAKTIPFRVDVALRADALTAMMLCMVTFVATWVAVFGAGYMHGDPGYWRFFTYVNLFVFSMTMLVSVSNFLLLFVFWEAVGVCSYLLIGFWFTKPEAAAAGKKAFLVNRIGDFGLTLALFLIWTNYHTLNYHDTTANGLPVEAAVSADSAASQSVSSPGVMGQTRLASKNYIHGPVATAICLLLLLGACGKSAQFPLHLWLPDAMEGPTPVSALIHAATMVTAGVYMMTRCTPLFAAAPDVQLVVAVIGGFTALLAGLIALTQNDLKRVMAYSTVSQLGYMFLGVGVGSFAGITAGMFHLFTHAFFKGLLFLGSGSVMHAMGHIIDMRRFSGLRRIMPITHATMLVGCLALAGMFPLAGFWSKDAILGALHDRIHELDHELEHAKVQPKENGSAYFVSTRAVEHEHADHSVVQRTATTYRALYYMSWFTAFLTAFYTFRAFFMTFYGEEKIPAEAGDHAHESPQIMTIPLIVLAVCAAVMGMAFIQPTNWGTNRLVNFLGNTPSLAIHGAGERAAEPKFHDDLGWTSFFVAGAGILIAMYFYMGDRSEAAALKRLFSFEGADHLLDANWTSRLKQVGWINTLRKSLKSYGLGWIVSIADFLLQMLTTLLAVPLIIGSWINPYRLSLGKFFLDEICYWALVWPLELLAGLLYLIDKWIVDGFVNLVGSVPKYVGAIMRHLQLGLVQFYAFAMVAGAIVVVAARLLFAK